MTHAPDHLLEAPERPFPHRHAFGRVGAHPFEGERRPGRVARLQGRARLRRSQRWRATTAVRDP